MTKTLIAAKDAPPPGGAYSPALAVGDWFFAAGQGGFDSSGALVSPEIEGQTEQAFRNIDDLLEAAGLTRGDIVSCLVHLSDLSLFPRYNAVYERQFPDEPRPVRTTVGAALLSNMLVEITVVARRGASGKGAP